MNPGMPKSAGSLNYQHVYHAILKRVIPAPDCNMTLYNVSSCIEYMKYASIEKDDRKRHEYVYVKGEYNSTG